jgi:hypothetical protein
MTVEIGIDIGIAIGIETIREKIDSDPDTELEEKCCAARIWLICKDFVPSRSLVCSPPGFVSRKDASRESNSLALQSPANLLDDRSRSPAFRRNDHVRDPSVQRIAYLHELAQARQGILRV